MASIAKALLQMQAPVNITNNVGDTALHWACFRAREVDGMTDVIEHLLLAGAEPSAVGDIGNTPLHLAAAASSVPVRFSSAPMSMYRLTCESFAPLCDFKNFLKPAWGRSPLFQIFHLLPLYAPNKGIQRCEST
jgi:hypothetical protein